MLANGNKSSLKEESNLEHTGEWGGGDAGGSRRGFDAPGTSPGTDEARGRDSGALDFSLGTDEDWYRRPGEVQREGDVDKIYNKQKRMSCFNTAPYSYSFQILTERLIQTSWTGERERTRMRQKQHGIV